MTVSDAAPRLDPLAFARHMAPLLAAMFLGFLTVGLPLPALPLHVSSHLGFGTAAAGFAVGIQSLATVLTRAPSGRMVDAKGSKATLALGLLLSSGAGWVYLLSTAAAGTPTLSLAVLIAGRLLLGVGESLLITGVLSWAIVRAGSGQAGRAMSWNGMAQYGALAAGAPLGFALYGRLGFGAVSIATALLPLAGLAAVLPLPPVPPVGGTRMPLLGVVGRIWPYGVALMLAGIGFAAVATFASLDFAARGWSGAGFALFAYGGCFIAVRVVAGGLPDRLGGMGVAALSMTCEAVGQALLWLAPGPAVALAGAGLTGAGCSLVFPALGVEAFGRVPPANRGIAVGAFAAFQDVAIGLTGPVLGTLAALAGPSSVYLVGMLAATVGTGVALRLHRRAAGASADNPAARERRP